MQVEKTTPTPSIPDVVTGQGRRLTTLREALELAARQGPDVAAARANAAVAGVSVERAWNAWKPDLVASGQVDHTNAPAELDFAKFAGALTAFTNVRFDGRPAPPAVSIVGANSTYGTVQLSQPLFSPQGLFLIGPAHRSADAAALGADEAREQVLLNVARAYLGVKGLYGLLEAAREHGVSRYLQVSTDEVYGSLGAEGRFSESSPIQPSSPYSASKAASDLIALSYHHTYGLDVVVTRCSNNYGPYQFPEKLIPLMIANAMEGKKLPVYGDGMQVRDWIHVDDHCAALLAALEKGAPGEVYNIGSDNEWPNLAIVRAILKELGKDEGLIEHVKDRLGHDRRYAIDARKAHQALGWAPRIPFAQGLAATVAWYGAHRPWWERVRSGAYRAYYEKNYGARG
ncbi:MAG: hypothetical protein NVS4B10_14890 [Myxococcales bacterium]